MMETDNRICLGCWKKQCACTLEQAAAREARKAEIRLLDDQHYGGIGVMVFAVIGCLLFMLIVGILNGLKP